MKNRVPSGNRAMQSFTVYKFEVNPVNPEISRVQAWKNLTSAAAHKIIPPNYRLCDETTIRSKDYYLIVHLKSGEDNICYYYINND